MRFSSSLVLPAVLLLVACGGSPAPAPATASDAPAPAASTDPSPTDPPPPAAAAAAPADAPVGIPSTCADKAADVCTPPSSFVERLCAKPHQDAALALFAASSPFSRLYMKGKMDELVWDEEVLALRYHGVPKNGIQVGSGAGSYDVLRWDGSCSMAVDAGMLTKNKPARPRTAHLRWHRIGDRSQTALITASEPVKKLHAKRGKECQGAMSGDVSAACEKADEALGDAIVEYVRGGGTVPAPDGL